MSVDRDIALSPCGPCFARPIDFDGEPVEGLVKLTHRETSFGTAIVFYSAEDPRLESRFLQLGELPEDGTLIRDVRNCGSSAPGVEVGMTFSDRAVQKLSEREKQQRVCPLGRICIPDDRLTERLLF